MTTNDRKLVFKAAQKMMNENPAGFAQGLFASLASQPEKMSSDATALAEGAMSFFESIEASTPMAVVYTAMLLVLVRDQEDTEGRMTDEAVVELVRYILAKPSLADMVTARAEREGKH